MSWDEVERLQNDPKRHEKKKEEINVDVEGILDLPLLAGQRFCLNPEAERFKTLNSGSKGSAGYVLSVETSEDSLADWKRKSTSSRNNIILRVRFDNYYETKVYMKEILPIDSQSKTIEKMTVGGSVLYCIEGLDERERKNIDEWVICDGYTLKGVEIFDDAYRKRILEKINS